MTAALHRIRIELTPPPMALAAGVLLGWCVTGQTLRAQPASGVGGPASPPTASAAKPAPTPDQQAVADQIVVTASKLGQTKRAPTAITTLDQKTIDRLHIQTVEDAQVTVPGLVYTDNGGTAQAFIRGIGTNFSYAGLESSVATYVDGVYLQRQVGAAVDVLDLKSLQVLSGPQGSLYGRNATGGVLLVQTNDPGPNYSGEIGAEIGNLDHGKVDGIVNIPVSSTVSVRLAGQWNKQGDYITNRADGAQFGGDDHTTGRGKIAWTPSDAWKFIAGVEYNDDTNHVAAEHERLGVPLCVACTLFHSAPPSPGDFYGVNLDTQPDTTIKSLAGTLRAYYTGGIVDVSGTFGVRRQVYRIYVDQDFAVGDFLHTFAKEAGTTFTADVFAKSHFDGPLNFLAGTSLEDDTDQLTGTLYGAAVGPLQGLTNFARVRLQSASVYAEGYYDITPRLRLTVGGRYNIDDKGLTSTNDAFAQIAFQAPTRFEEERTFRDFTPRIALSYSTPDVNYYASIARGAKSGGFNTPAFTPAPPLKSEVLTSYELGLKSDLLHHDLHANAAIFYYRYRDIQVSFIDAASGAVFGENAASADSYGLEWSTDYRVIPALTVRAGGLLLHSRFDKFPNAAVFVPAAVGLANGGEDLSGTPLARSPDFSGYLGFAYQHRLPFGWQGEFDAVDRFTGRYLFAPGAGGPLQLDRQAATNLVTLSATATSPSTKYEIRAYINNAADEKYFRTAQTAATGAEYDAAPPLTFGFSARARF